MATHQMSILGANTIPDTSGNVFQQPYSILDTGCVALDPMVYVFKNTCSKDGLRGSFVVPQNYVGTPKVIMLTNNGATSGNNIWDLNFLSRADNEDMGAAADSTADTVTLATAGTAWLLDTATFACMSATDFVAGQYWMWEVFRDGAGGDNVAADVNVFDVIFEYADV